MVSRNGSGGRGEFYDSLGFSWKDKAFQAARGNREKRHVKLRRRQEASDNRVYRDNWRAGPLSRHMKGDKHTSHSLWVASSEPVHPKVPVLPRKWLVVLLLATDTALTYTQRIDRRVQSRLNVSGHGVCTHQCSHRRRYRRRSHRRPEAWSYHPRRGLS